MVHRGISVIAVGLLAISTNMVADTQIQLLEKAFNAEYRSLFPERGNSIESKTIIAFEKKNLHPLTGTMKDLVKLIYKQYPAYGVAISHLNDAAQRIIEQLKKISERNLMMDPVAVWEKIRESTSKVLQATENDVREANNIAAQVVVKKSEKDDIKGLIDHIGQELLKAVLKILKDTELTRNAIKLQEYTPEQAETMASNIKAVNDDATLDNVDKWAKIMNLLGIDKQVNEENFRLALKKFGIAREQEQLITTGLIFKGKGNVKMALFDLYKSLHH